MARTWLLIFLGQLISFDLAIISYTASLITNQGVDAPLSVSLFSYLALAVVCGGIMLCRKQKLQLSWYWYVPIGFVDVQGNYLVVKAYEYTSITSVTLLDCCITAWAIVLTRLFLSTRYTMGQFFGVGFCLFGFALLVFSDYDPTAQGASKPLFGDFLVIAGTVFLAMSCVSTEFCAKKKDIVEVVAMIGVFGTLFSGAGMATYERKSIESITWSLQLVFAYVGCTMSTFMLYVFTPFFLKMGGSTLYNLSMLTSDMWVLLIRIFIYKQQVEWLYYPAYALVFLGIYIYLTKGKDESVDVVDDLQEENVHDILVCEDTSLLVERNR